MPERYKPIATPGSLPNNYQEVLSWKVTEKPIRIININILGLFLFVIFGFIFSRLAIGLGNLPSQGEFKFGLGAIIFIIAGAPLTLVLHELAHGLVMQLFGARPKYGILRKQMLFYATSPGYAYRRNNYLDIALAPFILISILAVLGMWLLQGTVWAVLFGICGVINASGAAGDLWITVMVLRYPAIAYIIDERDGIRVFLPKS
ncbi:MAG TPA: DUF3267 domain-containing protein [Anaerolineales bacterium]|nr:DUF3267 domain-containing protein [Anaerolineales bacterium]HLO31703.1 DUF3267 domain-containing protein [Anaerolineales bacterium]